MYAVRVVASNTEHDVSKAARDRVPVEVSAMSAKLATAPSSTRPCWPSGSAPTVTAQRVAGNCQTPLGQCAQRCVERSSAVRRGFARASRAAGSATPPTLVREVACCRSKVFCQVQCILVSYRPLDRLCRARRMKARDVISLSLTGRLLTLILNYTNTAHS